jgi:hypothetical protein
VIDRNIEVPIRLVQPEQNAHRSRAVPPPIEPAPDTPPSGLNAPDLFLDRMTGQDPDPEDADE